MKNLLLLTLVAAFFIHQGVLQQAVAQQNDPKATEILNEVSKKYKAMTSMRAVFAMSAEDAKGKAAEAQTGTLYAKGPMYKIELANQEIISDNKTVWTYLKDANEVQINNYEADPNSINPAEIFTIYENNFFYALTGEETVGGKAHHVIELTPHDKSRSYFKVRLLVDKADKTVRSAKIFDKGGTRTNLDVQKLTPNFALNEGFFSFDPKKYPGIEVVDLR
ncbi:MAG TPA: outer membrane lipoprotein carrier protein LolA [Chitinophagales bacterium]|nr:outer membrane lipoprotein carrier protein LolA [Chitinophagales bacterium]